MRAQFHVDTIAGFVEISSMLKRTSALIAKAEQARSRELKALDEARSTLRELDARQYSLSMKEALLAGCSRCTTGRGEYTAGELAIRAGWAEQNRRKLSAVSQEAARIERDREQAARHLKEIQERVATTSRLLEQLSRMK